PEKANVCHDCEHGDSSTTQHVSSTSVPGWREFGSGNPRAPIWRKRQASSRAARVALRIDESRSRAPPGPRPRRSGRSVLGRKVDLSYDWSFLISGEPQL